VDDFDKLVFFLLAADPPAENVETSSNWTCAQASAYLKWRVELRRPVETMGDGWTMPQWVYYFKVKLHSDRLLKATRFPCRVYTNIPKVGVVPADQAVDYLCSSVNALKIAPSVKKERCEPKKKTSQAKTTTMATIVVDHAVRTKQKKKKEYDESSDYTDSEDETDEEEPYKIAQPHSKTKVCVDGTSFYNMDGKSRVHSPVPFRKQRPIKNREDDPEYVPKNTSEFLVMQTDPVIAAQPVKVETNTQITVDREIVFAAFCLAECAA
jgi:hypothetical protein